MEVFDQLFKATCKSEAVSSLHGFDLRRLPPPPARLYGRSTVPPVKGRVADTRKLAASLEVQCATADHGMIPLSASVILQWALDTEASTIAQSNSLANHPHRSRFSPPTWAAC